MSDGLSVGMVFSHELSPATEPRDCPCIDDLEHEMPGLRIKDTQYYLGRQKQGGPDQEYVLWFLKYLVNMKINSIFLIKGVH